MTLDQIEAIVELGAQPRHDGTIYVSRSRMRAIIACLRAADSGDATAYKDARARLDAIGPWPPVK